MLGIDVNRQSIKLNRWRESLSGRLGQQTQVVRNSHASVPFYGDQTILTYLNDLRHRKNYSLALAILCVLGRSLIELLLVTVDHEIDCRFGSSTQLVNN